MPNQPIPVAEANIMVGQYLSYMTGLGVVMSMQTHSISFEKEKFQKWLGEVMPFSDELRIFMGVYPPGHQHAGRTTVILWPYMKGEPAVEPYVGNGSGDDDDEEIEPYNDGGLTP